MDEYRKTMLGVHAIGNRIKNDRETILKSGLSERKIREDLLALEERAQVEAKLINNQLSEIAQQRIEDGKKIADDFRHKGKDASMMLYNQNKATAAFSGLSPDEVLEKYPQVVSSLNEEEFAYLYVYEDTVKALLRDKVASLAIEQVISEHKGAHEKAATNELERREGFLDTDATIKGMIAENLEELAKGEAALVNDFASIYDELDAGHGKYRESVNLTDEVKIPDDSNQYEQDE